VPANHHSDAGPAGQQRPEPVSGLPAKPQPGPEPVSGLPAEPQPGPEPVSRFPAEPQPGPALARQEPSWPTVIATTIRLWWERHGRRWRWAGVAVLTAVLLAGAGLAMALSRPDGKAPGRPREGGANPVRTAQAARAAAAAWIEQQVSGGTIVSCDPVMCSVLLAHGFPAADLDPLGPSTPDPLTSNMIAATAVLRSQFGPRLTSVYAPIILASFGTGSAEVDVRVIASDGSPAYMRQFRADLKARKAYGAQILHNSKIVVAPPARRQLASGMVDSRLLMTISTAAHQGHRLRVVSFGAAAPGASPGVPVRSAVIAGAASGPGARTAVLDKLRRFWLGQRAPFLPASTQIVPAASGQSALRIQFAAPSLLKLLGAGNPVVKTHQ
jgi:hypothetical protein